MQLRIADTFTASLAKLPNDQQRVAKTTAFDLQTNITNPGLSLHRVTGRRDSGFWSARVNLYRGEVTYSIEIWAWAFTDRAAPPEVKETIRKIAA